MDDALEQAAKKIIADTYTKADGYARLRLLEDVVEGQVYGGQKDDADLTLRISERYSDGPDREPAAAVAKWGIEIFRVFSGPNLHERIDEVKKSIESAPELVLYAPIAFGSEQIRALGIWCRANVDPETFLELRVDASVVGGCSFVWRDTLHDFSLTSRMRAHDKELIARIDSYLASAV